MATPHKAEEMPFNLAQLMERGKREVEEACRALGGDPDQAFDDFVRRTYDLESLEKIFREMVEDGPGWLEDNIDEPSID